MDELNINLGSTFMKKLAATIIKKAIGKKIGFDADILVNEVRFVSENGKVRVHADIDVEASDSDVKGLISRYLHLPL